MFAASRLLIGEKGSTYEWKTKKYDLSMVMALVSGDTPLDDPIRYIEEAKTAHQLMHAMNKVQSRLWKLSSKQQLSSSHRVVVALRKHALNDTNAPLRLEAASWLRMLVQTGVVAQPEDVFVILVTAAIHAFQSDTKENTHEFENYLRMIFDSLWPFRSSYAVYARELFPSREVFYPLVPLFSQVETDAQEFLLLIFAELPTPQNF